jgi:hypothetical protein
MNHISAIQEIVDESKEAMPTGVVARVMEECQKAHDAIPMLYKVRYVSLRTYVHANGEAMTMGEDRMQIGERTTRLVFDAFRAYRLLTEEGLVDDDWIRAPMPLLVYSDHEKENLVAVVTSVLAYLKRGRA